MVNYFLATENKVHCNNHVYFNHSQEGRFAPYNFQQTVWTTPHNTDHGYVRNIIAINVHGKQGTYYSE